MRFRAQRRGFRELDLIFGVFAEEFLPALDSRGLDRLEALLDVPDQDVFAWLKGEAPVPAEHDTEVFTGLRSVCARTRPVWNV